MRRVLIGVLAVVLLSTAAAPAQAVTIQGPAWAQQAVDQMRVPVAPGQTVVLGSCPGYASEAAACNFTTADSAIYIDPQSLFGMVGAMRVVLYRELGGRFATLAMYPWAVEHFERILHRPVRPLTVGMTERFEDAYSDCAQGLEPRRDTLQYTDNQWEDSAGYEPSRRQHARVCALIARVGAHARYETPRPIPSGQPGREGSSRPAPAARP